VKAKLGLADRDIDNNIAYLKDMSTHLGGMTITNDAENVVDYCRSLMAIVFVLFTWIQIMSGGKLNGRWNLTEAP